MESIMSRVRTKTPAEPWQDMKQPIPLVKVVAQPIQPGSSTVRYVATGITNEAEAMLSQIQSPLFIVAFAGVGRSGKSYTATALRQHITGNSDHKVNLTLKIVSICTWKCSSHSRD
jgi:pantothenate kinase